MALALGLGLALPQAAPAQDSQTLADIRQEMSVLFVEVQRLRRELSTTGAPGVTIPGGSVLDRVGLMESELQRLTRKTEELEFRINAIVSDGTTRLGDLEFRLCELEPGCDIGKLGQTTTLGGGTAPATTGQIASPIQPAETQTAPTAELAIGERADFDRAAAALASGDFRSAADLFAAFNETYPGGPLSAEADMNRGKALAQLDDVRGAARAYLSAFTTDQTGPQAPEALFLLGEALGRLGQTQEACTTLQEVGLRFPQSSSVAAAQEARARLGCL
ncbi:MAG: tol-pal system protein YbgF [Paracoccaceae bacterium]|jgi:tol-pal system protein YbgF|nr:tol-pal system protein YbgF [Paracoccaceae bacterium]MDP5364838.1 tol-pal system protein YbgF [Paracoccaceae bacterium]